LEYRLRRILRLAAFAFANGGASSLEQRLVHIPKFRKWRSESHRDVLTRDFRKP
jgi:hypothetical protein